jgi:hypothetical protein
VRQVPLDAAGVADADRVGVVLADELLHAAAALAADQLGVLLLEPAASAEQRALDLRAGHAHALAEGLVGPRGHRTDDAGLLAGPMLYDLTEDGWAAVEADRLAV